MSRITHTVATLELPKHIWDTIAERLRAAGYDHAFDGELIDMNGIGLIPIPEPKYDDFQVIKEAIAFQWVCAPLITPETKINDFLARVDAVWADIAQIITNSTGVWMEEAIYREDVHTFGDVARVHNEGGDGTGDYPY